MAIYKSKYKRYNGTGWDEFYFETTPDQIIGLNDHILSTETKLSITDDTSTQGKYISRIQVNNHELTITKEDLPTKNTVGATNNTNKIHLVGVLDANKNSANPQSFVSTGEVSVTNGALFASGKITGSQLEITHMLGAGGTEDNGILFKRDGVAVDYRMNMSNHNLNFISGSTRSLVIDQVGNTVIGETTSANNTYKLTVKGTSKTEDDSFFDKNVSVKEAIKMGSTEQSQIIYNEGTKSIDFIFV